MNPLKLIASLGLLVACVSGNASDQIPGAPQKQPIAIVGGVIHTVVGRNIENGMIIIVGGKITFVGKDGQIPEGAEVIRAEGKHIYPSMIDANTDIGLVEINSVRATIDSRETGTMNPNVRAAVAFNADSELIPVNRANGILLAVSAPTGGLISGRSSLMMLDGWTWEDMTLKADTGMHIRWPRDNGRDVEALEKIFDQATRYAAARSAGADQPMDLRLESLAPVLEGKMPLVADANSISQIESVVAFAKQRKLKLIIHGGIESAECADLLKQSKVPVIVSGVYRIPSGRDQPYDDAYTLPHRLSELGVEFCISSGGRFGASGVRNLPYHAATAAAFGLTQDQAIRAITLSAAKILGVEDSVGSISVDRDATLFVCDGNILETETQVERAFIQGRKVDLDNRHTQLYRKYREKYERK